MTASNHGLRRYKIHRPRSFDVEAAKRLYVSLSNYTLVAALCGVSRNTVWEALNPEHKEARNLKRDNTIRERVRVRVVNANRAAKTIHEKDTGRQRRCIEGSPTYAKCQSFKTALRKRVHNSVGTTNRKAQKLGDPYMLNVDEVLAKILANPVCHYSGLPINLKGDVWQLDHIKPLARGGNNHIDNYVLCLQAYNSMKGDLTVEEMTLAAARFLEHLGFTIAGHEDRDFVQEARTSARELFEAKCKRECRRLTKEKRAEKAATLLTSNVSSAYKGDPVLTTAI